MTAPEQQLEQRRTAIKKANDVRMHRAYLKRDLKAGKLSALNLLDDPPDWLKTMKVTKFLQSIHKVGQVRIDKCIKAWGILPETTIGDMSNYQRINLRAQADRWMR